MTKAEYSRVKLTFSSGGELCHADFYTPANAQDFPTIVMAHGLGGTRGMRLPAFAERFVEEGYACLVFDYRHFGESEGLPRQLLDIKKQRQDWVAATCFARELPGVDRNRLILWGTSFGGGHVLATAANQSIAAVIAQCPFTDGWSSSLAMNPWTSVQLTMLALRDRIGSWFGLEPLMVTTAGRPGQVAMMNAPDVWDGHSAIAAGTNSPNQIAARFALDIIRDCPGRRTPEIEAPVLFCVCDSDTVAPAKATLRHAARAPRGEIKRYQDGHFAIYVGEAYF